MSDALFSSVGRFMARILFFLNANPDFEHLYGDIAYWYLEVEDSVPVREVGFGENGEPLVLGPYGNNYGQWTDSPVTLDPEDYAAVTEDEFMKAWKSLADRLSK